jgi:hypothetical protein
VCGFIGSVLVERTQLVVAFKCVEMVAACLRFIPEFAETCCKTHKQNQLPASQLRIEPAAP